MSEIGDPHGESETPSTPPAPAADTWPAPQIPAPAAATPPTAATGAPWQVPTGGVESSPWAAPGWVPPAAPDPWAPPYDAGAAAQWGGWQHLQHWEPPAPPRRSHRPILAAILAGIFVAGLGLGIAGQRVLTTSPRSSTSGPLGLLLPQDGTGSSSDNGNSAGTGSGDNSNGSGSGGSADSATGDTSSVAAKVTPGVVDVNVTIAGGGSAAGTGMVITSSGEVLTNNHVIDGAQSISVRVAGTGPVYTAHIMGYDVTDDVALLQVESAPRLTTVKLGSATKVAVGQAVVAIGNALGRSGPPSVSSGQVTALDQQITATDAGGANAETLYGLIQIDAPIQPGDSGGPLADTSGRVIGMDTAAQTSSRFRFRQQASTIAFAIPIDAAMSVVRQIQSGKGTSTVTIGQSRALLGIEVQDVQGGVQVVQVQSGSPAAGAEIAAGDLITSIDGTSVYSQSSLHNALATHRPGDRISVGWVDDTGTPHTATVTLTTGPPA